MSRWLRRAVVRLGLSLAVFALGSGLLLIPAAAQQPSLERVVLGTSTGLTSSVYIAIERGYFAAEGISTDVENFRTPPETAPGVATGQLDIGLQGVAPALFNLIARDTGARIVVD